MNKFYTLISAGLIAGGLVFTSCSEDEKIINENQASDIWEENLTDYTATANIMQPSALQTVEIEEGRATVSAGKYVWQRGDSFTLWNKNLGRGGEFTTSPEYQSASATANFIGKATINNGDRILAVYPAREIKNFNDLKTFVLPAITEQTTTDGGLHESSFMVAEAVSGDIALPELNFKPLTALLQFNLKNVTSESITLKSLAISSEDKIFPTEMTINDNGEITSLEEPVQSLTLNLNNQSVASQEIFFGYLNVLPTTYGDVTFMTDDTKITVKANISVALGEDIFETEVTLLNNVAVKEFVNKFSYDMAETAYQFASGRYYPMDLDVDYHFYVPAEGYIVDNSGNLEIYTPTGFNHWKESGETYKSKTVKLCATPQSQIVIYNDPSSYNVDFAENKTIDLANNAWTAFNLTGTFEGEGFTIKNLKLNNGGFFGVINGEVNNLNFDGVTYNTCSVQTGTIAISNNGNINNCSVKNVAMSNITAKSPIGGLVAENKINGIIDNCYIETVNATLKPASGAGNADLGAIAGENNGTIINTRAIDINFNHTQNSDGKSNVGALVGINKGGKIKGCYAEAKIQWSCSATLGGLVGTNASGFIQASYVFGTITANSNANGNVGGLVGGNNAGKIGSCYSTIDFTGTLPTQKGGICGWDAQSKGTFNECYAICEEGMNPVKENPSAGTVAENAERIANDVRFFNLGIERFANFGMNVLPDVKVSFKKNEDAATSAQQPIILVKESVTEPGFGGSDFGDGGSI